ncbi:uncharacterized protein BJ171DRAFT_601941 [Polychytrium aggregatum]|uniref:uncharacterized protein n=1 Tax=Polychytrium aggregatum TaxID=110093 RepID=UPI0022FEEE8E|nr:uncharacterized protein BJ171DRAFT_601941 [Polychytrium aggregatum]KAI9199364.1 hypothetical protein BJ171DRAFT_601941 [Polychytrium aggregatum]
MPDIAKLSLEHNPDIFTIICCNESFQLALDHNTVKTLLRVCRRAEPLLSSKLDRFYIWYQADKGNAAASYLLAWKASFSLYGWRSVGPSERVAIQQEIFYRMEKAAEADHFMAQFQLAECYRSGVGTNQDHTKAAELYRSLAERGILQAQIALGRCYENGEGVDQDYTTAIGWYSKAANQGSDDGRLHMVFLRGWFSFIVHGVEQSDVDAFNHWQQVSTHSTNPVIKPIATHMLGWMHYFGRGTERDEQKGVEIIRENKPDGFELEEGVLIGYVASSNSPASRKFFNLCLLGSDREWLCRHLMALCLTCGFGTLKDQEKAASIFEQLANEGHSDSQYWIGSFYYDQGVSKSCEKGFEWYSKSADQGHSYGQYMVGCCYFYGNGVTQDYAKAAEWYRESAEQGNRYGQYHLGDCYKNGHGVPEDIETAAFWYRRSADQGWQDAINQLKMLGKWP